jgi:tetratricopeptide (TPR) repeat protein
LATVTLAVYAPVLKFDFIDFDDPPYVTENPQVQAGLTVSSIRWAFTQGHSSNWHPLTWISHMLDVELYGRQASGHHATNVLLHTGNTLLLFGLLLRLTGKAGRSAMVAGLFALHPLHVESVAWIAERKDVLSTFFGLWTLWAYARYVERPRAARYLAALGLFALGLMSKPMLVTWPFVLLLLDYWPLKRVDAVPWRTLLREKVPFLVLAVASAVVTYIVQREGGAVAAISRISAGMRLQTALVAYVAYIGKLFWPVHLSVMYPLIRDIPVAQVVGAGAVLALITGAVWRGARRFPYLATGWLWYVGTLVPVIGLVQVGTQRMADRYTYIPYIGWFVLGVWFVADWAERRRISHVRSAFAAGAILCILATLTIRHLPVWRSSIPLYEQALTAGESGALVHFNLGNCMAKQNRMKDAAAHYLESLRHAPGEPDVYCNLGLAWAGLDRKEEAVEVLRKAIQLQPDHPKARENIGNILADLGRIEEAAETYREVMQWQPENASVRYKRAGLLVKMGCPDEAISTYQESFRLLPQPPDTLCRWGVAQAEQGRSAMAIAHFLETLRIDPDHLAALNALVWIRATDPDPAIRKGAEAVTLAERLRARVGSRPQAAILDTIAAAYAEAGRFDEAIRTAGEAEQIAQARGAEKSASEIGARRELYLRKQPYRSPAVGTPVDASAKPL